MTSYRVFEISGRLLEVFKIPHLVVAELRGQS